MEGAIFVSQSVDPRDSCTQQTNAKGGGRALLVRFVSANVLTMRLGDEGDKCERFSTLRLELEQSFDGLQVGVQEARARIRTQRQDHYFSICGVAAEKGAGGVVALQGAPFAQ